MDGAQTRISAVRSRLDKDAGRSMAIVRWLQSGSAAVRDWLLWQVVPIVVFALAWLGFCAFCFTVLVPSGELGVDQWRAKLMTTVGVVAASVFWVSFVTVRTDPLLDGLLYPVCALSDARCLPLDRRTNAKGRFQCSEGARST